MAGSQPKPLLGIRPGAARSSLFLHFSSAGLLMLRRPHDPIVDRDGAACVESSQRCKCRCRVAVERGEELTHRHAAGYRRTSATSAGQLQKQVERFDEIVGIMHRKSSVSDERLVVHAKSNLSETAIALRLRVEARRIVHDGTTFDTSAMVWVGEAPDMTQSRLLASRQDDGGRPSEKLARDVICEELADDPLSWATVEASIFQAGPSASSGRRARDGLRDEKRIESYKDGQKGGWYWRLTPSSHESNLTIDSDVDKFTDTNGSRTRGEQVHPQSMSSITRKPRWRQLAFSSR
jgi:hypothetical protein